MWPGEVGGCGVEEVSGETLTENLSSELAVDSDSFRMVADAEVLRRATIHNADADSSLRSELKCLEERASSENASIAGELARMRKFGRGG